MKIIKRVFVDDRQPTTPETVAWACANLDNTLDSPITEWYMKMFGWTDSAIPRQNPLRMGFAPLAVGAAVKNPQTIITLDSFTMRGHEYEFWHTFRQIAANPVAECFCIDC